MSLGVYTPPWISMSAVCIYTFTLLSMCAVWIAHNVVTWQCVPVQCEASLLSVQSLRPCLHMACTTHVLHHDQFAYSLLNCRLFPWQARNVAYHLSMTMLTGELVGHSTAHSIAHVMSDSKYNCMPGGELYNKLACQVCFCLRWPVQHHWHAALSLST